ncbi:MAG: hypothetical protein HND48_24300 [Chloroflexi bacterium]|nr:hypothetical protein [Chloroflexota bacterium]
MWWYGAYKVHRGVVDREALMNSIALLKSGLMILIAPEGTRSPHGLQEPKDGMTYVATKADAVILPAGLSGAQHFKHRFPRRHACSASLRPAVSLQDRRARAHPTR